MILRTGIGALVLLALGLVAAARGAESQHSITEMTSDLQVLQARMAAGDKSAYSLAQSRLRAIAAAIAAAKPEVWRDKSETNAVAIYMLSGGQPREVARLLESGDVPASTDPLLRGALAYASGREREALALLGGIDPNKVSLRLAGQLAFAQSVLLTSRDPKRAVALLDLARTYSPGSLVEEASLRREILLVGEQHDPDRAAFLARQYVSRFGHSIYAENFIQGLAEATIKNGLGDNVDRLMKFKPLLTLVTPEQRHAFLLTIARAAIIDGDYRVGAAAAREAASDAQKGSVDEARAQLYMAATQFVGPDYDAGVAALGNVDRSRLPKPDQALLTAATFAATHLREPPSRIALEDARREDRVAAARSPNAAKSVNADPVSQTIERAETDLAEAAAIGGSAP
jgi:chemotaxis protein MotC